MKVTKADGTVVENVYDVDGVLVRTVVNGVATDLLVDTSGGLSHVVAEVDGGGTVTALYVRAGDMLLEEVRGGVAKMYKADGLGSVRSLLETDTWSYEAFGTTVSETGTSVNPYRFAGERYVGDVGMYQNRARWLDTRVGRFVSVDPLLDETGMPYLYADNNPASWADPTGRETAVNVVAAVAIGSVLGALSGAGFAEWRAHVGRRADKTKEITVSNPGLYDGQVQPVVASWLYNATHFGEVYMVSLGSMLHAIFNEALRNDETISRLNIVDHGVTDGVGYLGLNFGIDFVTSDDYTEFEPYFRRLAGAFAPRGFIHLQHCGAAAPAHPNVPQLHNRPLMAAIASTVGVPVYGGTGSELWVYRFNAGDYYRCDPNTTCTKTSRP